MSRDEMVGFGSKQAWLAIGDRAADTVLEALGWHDLGPVSWRQGVDLAYLTDDRLAATPPLPDARDPGKTWVLVLGRALFAGDVDARIIRLSEMLDTEVQFFSSYRVGERHRWSRAVNGVLVRDFAYAGDGEITVWWGDPDEHERALGLPETRSEGDESGVLVGESDVLHLADAWSINPATLDRQPAPGPLLVAAE